VAEPELEIGNVETALEALTETCYFLTSEKNRYRFSLAPNLNKLLVDRRASKASRGFRTRSWSAPLALTRIAIDEPGMAVCGVENPGARKSASLVSSRRAWARGPPSTWRSNAAQAGHLGLGLVAAVVGPTYPTASLHHVPAENRQEMDKSALRPILLPAKLLLELVELTGIEPVTS
jgi:hypothetical protein